MKKLFLLAFAAFFIVAGTQAQTTKRSDSTARKEFRQRTRKPNHEMAKLNLTADQKAKMKTLREENMKNRQAIQQDKSLTPEQRKQKFADLRKQNHQNMDGVLTPEQKSQMDQFRKERAANKQNMKKGHKGNKDWKNKDKSSQGQQ